MSNDFKQGKWEDLILSLSDSSIDLIYTDPPYGLGYVSNIPGDKRWNKSGETFSKFSKPILNDSDGDIDFDAFAKECFRVLKPDSYLVLHCNIIWIGKNIHHFTKHGFSYKGTVAWNKKFAVGGDIQGSMKRDWEPILYLAKGSPKMRSIEVLRRVGSNYENVIRERISEISDWEFKLPRCEKLGFPTQKPKDLCKQVIKLTTDVGALVLDPFAGSGTIGKVCKEIDRNSLSFEADEDVYKKFLKDLGQ